MADVDKLIEDAHKYWIKMMLSPNFIKYEITWLKRTEIINDILDAIHQAKKWKKVSLPTFLYDKLVMCYK